MSLDQFHFSMLWLGTHLLDKVSRPRDSERTFSVFGSSFYQTNHSMVEAISLSALPKDTTSELAGLSSHIARFYDERQAGKL